MAIQYARNERELRRYEYSKTSVKKRRISRVCSENNLIVTNERIISEVVTGESVRREEMPVKNAAYLNTSYNFHSKPFIMLVLGILLLICGAVLIALSVKGVTDEGAVRYIGIVQCVVGLAFVIGFFLSAASAGVHVTIYSDLPCNEVMSFGSSFSTGKVRRRKSKKAAKVRITVDKNAAIDMIDNLGAFILDVKNGVYATGSSIGSGI